MSPTTTTVERARGPWTPLVVLVGGSILLYLPLVGYRWDYLSHFLIGAGAVVGLVGVARVVALPTDGLAVGTAATVLVASAVTEHLWFGALVFDWGDIGVGGLGACCAAAGLLGTRDAPRAGALVAVAVALTGAGFVLRFGVGGVPW